MPQRRLLREGKSCPEIGTAFIFYAVSAHILGTTTSGAVLDKKGVKFQSYEIIRIIGQ